ncbi:ADP-heptose:LPS heptosyltransferase [Arcticibacter tournemirensis]|uniref:Glycosyltransferase family 9 protein n=1 Tax=Arcticibacter tournemirensis TaxID=699437 RepID=A0A5M9HH37_9SPHI|nr:glycosyltransferase family 9 protein [Arcticibacter tournemirensis]KAA8484638.1 glycosyltransferase family 9 protein [Arcticibacter tournemirensis]TQM47072.1 ADP-heptose:LPS heptosyltransferase [Arcticibacter tournemirensis]
MKIKKPEHILISRTDAIGDVILTLPVCGLIKAHYPDCKISFLGRLYTKEVVQLSTHVDEFIDYDEWKSISDKDAVHFLRLKRIDTIIHVFPKKRIALIARQTGIPLRIGTTNRIYHWFTCNCLIRLSRKHSNFHESQLNIKLLKGINIPTAHSKEEISEYYGLSKLPDLQEEYCSLLSNERFNLILHPKSKGSGKEWSLERYSELIKKLDKSKFKLFVSGSTTEKALLDSWLSQHKDDVTDITGLLTLEQFIAFISKCDGLVASGTGPLHIAAALGLNALGLFPNVRPIHAGRWAPIGKKAEYIECTNADMDSITADMVYDRLDYWSKQL